VCQSHTGHLTELWFLPNRPKGWILMNEWTLFYCIELQNTLLVNLRVPKPKKRAICFSTADWLKYAIVADDCFAWHLVTYCYFVNMQSLSKLVTVNLRYACIMEFCVLYNCMGLNSVLECLRLFFLACFFAWKCGCNSLRAECHSLTSSVFKVNFIP